MEVLNTPAKRTPLLMEVEFKKNYAREESKGQLRNISVTGAFIENSRDQFRPEEKIYLKFKVGNRERKIAAKVVWTNSIGCGVAFMPTNNRDVQIVDDLIYFVETKRTSGKDIFDSILKKVG